MAFLKHLTNYKLHTNQSHQIFLDGAEWRPTAQVLFFKIHPLGLLFHPLGQNPFTHSANFSVEQETCDACIGTSER